MIIKYEVDCFGYSVGGRSKTFEIEFEENEFEGMTEEQKHNYIHKAIEEDILNNLEFYYDI